ncbi:hypothetical protein EUX98_g7561 [Antrodiella citrinella]|uniref:G-alpha-domain-containing protein n=1 Tax=Antrodiella citrinella TaxID=2447956 RepID=A0A4S4ML79_9APHY|nr:hypothetical protein EUX98_g7561 [Antrodiella citrinella]
MRFSSEVEDPISVLLKPPPDETLQQRDARLSMEAEAKRVSDQIDEGIRAERAAMKKRKDATKLLLLGQSESGKSTTLKNFQMTFAPKAWQTERMSWRAVIQLNLVRAVNTILDTLATEMAVGASMRPPSRGVGGSGGITSKPSSPPFSTIALGGDADDADDSDDAEEDKKTASSHSHTQRSSESHAPPALLPFTSTHSVLRLSLAPLRSIETDLMAFLGSGSEEINADDARFSENIGNMATPFDTVSVTSPPSSPRRRPQEFTVKSTWKNAVGNRSRGSSPRLAQHSDLDSVTEVIAGCREDIQALWQDTLVRELLRRKQIKLQDSATYYLDHVDMIARTGYGPSDNDVLRARLRTSGVQEHRITFENSADFHVGTHTDLMSSLPLQVEYGTEWIVYDVGGSRTSRWAWLPYFDDAHVILFLAPISCFDEQLAEDPKINRLQDSFILWRSIVSSKLLANCAIILFMNKYDLLSRKIKHGAVVKDYMTSYGERENSAREFTRYLRNQFKGQLREHLPEARPFYGFVTSVIDQKATATTLLYMRDSILRDHLKQADFV